MSLGTVSIVFASSVALLTSANLYLLWPAEKSCVGVRSMLLFDRAGLTFGRFLLLDDVRWEAVSAWVY